MDHNALISPSVKKPAEVARLPLSAWTIGTRIRRTRVILGCVLGAALLTACSSTSSFLSGTASAESDQQAREAQTGSGKSKHKRVRATRANDILAEWGTFGLDSRKQNSGRAFRSAALRPALTSEETLSIQEIMENVICHSCEDKPYHQMVLQAANTHGVPPGLIHAVIQKESQYNPGATSRKNARGLMQLTSGTARFVGVGNSRDLYDPQTNINAGAAYLKYLMNEHDTLEEVLAAYNAGPGSVRKYKGVPPFRETQRYVRDVKSFYSETSVER